MHTVDISSTIYLHRLVNVVCECPLIGSLVIQHQFFVQTIEMNAIGILIVLTNLATNRHAH